MILVIAVFCLGMARFTEHFPEGALVNELLAPLQSSVMRAWSSLGSTFSYIAQARQIKEENGDLQRQVRELTWENINLKEYVFENQRLLKLLDFKERNTPRFTLLGARVIGRAPNNQNGILIIDRGSADGIRENQVVVSDAGLVGQVIAIGSNTAEVLLIIDRDGAAGAMVQESRTPGVIEGGKEAPGLLRLVSLPYDAKLKKGQVVVTSGLGGIFPGGLPVGEVLKFENEGSELDKYALVRPFVDFNRLEELFIIMETRNVTESDLQNASGLEQDTQTNTRSNTQSN